VAADLTCDPKCATQQDINMDEVTYSAFLMHAYTATMSIRSYNLKEIKYGLVPLAYSDSESDF